MRLNELIPMYVDLMPAELDEGILYICKEYKTAIHLCACGCKQKTVTPINKPGEWSMSNNNGLVTLSPSIGNFNHERPNYHAHYFITNNKIIWQ